MSSRGRGWRRFGALLLAACLLGGALPAAAASDVQVQQVQVGFGQATRESALTSVKVSVENKGSEIRGRLVVVPKATQRAGYVGGSYEREVVLPANRVETYELMVPANLFRDAVDVKILDEQGVPLDVKTPTVQVIDNALMVGALTEDRHELNFLTSVNSSTVGGTVQVYPLAGEDVPSRAELLEGLDLLVVHEVPKTALTEAQKQAIRQWVERGGKLLLAERGAQVFPELSPVQVIGTRQEPLVGLQAYAKEAPPPGTFELAVGTLAEGARVLARSGETPLFVERNVGGGQVLFAAYDPSREPLASWSGNRELWGALLSQIGVESMEQQMRKGHLRFGWSNHQELIYASQLFERRITSLPLSMAVYGAYVLLVAPLMFWVLRRKGKREWGWVLIPSTALAFCLGIFLLGSEQRANGTMTQFLGSVELLSEQAAKLSGGATFVVTKGGAYEVEAAAGLQPYVPLVMQQGQARTSRVIQGDDGVRVRFEDVEYWSSRSSGVIGTLSGQGLLRSDLKVDREGRIKGSIENRSKFDLHDVFLFVGTEPFRLADLKQGQTISVEIPLQGLERSRPWDGDTRTVLKKMYPEVGNHPFSWDEERKRNLFGPLIGMYTDGRPAVRVAGLTGQDLELFEIKGMKSRNESLLVVHQELDLQYEESGSLLPPGVLLPRVIEEQGQVIPVTGGMVLNNAEVVLEYDLQMRPDFQVTSVRTNLDQAIYAMFEKSLYNWVTKRWEPVARENTPVLEGERVKPYLSPQGTLRIKLKEQAHAEQQVAFPSVGVEGKVLR
jgi:hypothetical protein